MLSVMKVVSLRVAIGVTLLVMGPSGLTMHATAQPLGAVSPDVLRAYREAEALFGNLQQSQALQLFTQVIYSLLPRAEAGRLSDAERELLLDSLSYRARAGFNVGQSDVVAADLERAIRLDP